MTIFRFLKEDYMAIPFESSTYIEFLLKNALDNAQIDYIEQYRIETGGVFSEVKYVADFFIRSDCVKLIVECDGITYHAGTDRQKNSIIRDKWLQSKGFRVLHFSTKHLKHEMPQVIECIKKNIASPSPVPFASSTKRQFKKNNLKNFNPRVTLFCYYRQVKNDVYFVYKYRENIKNIWSDERKRLCLNTPREMIAATAVFSALLDLKKNVTLQVIFSGTLHKPDYSIVKRLRSRISCFPNGSKILHDNVVVFEHLNIPAYSNMCNSEKLKTMRELKSRCLQISNYHSSVNDLKQESFDLMMQAK